MPRDPGLFLARRLGLGLRIGEDSPPDPRAWAMDQLRQVPPLDFIGPDGGSLRSRLPEYAEPLVDFEQEEIAAFVGKWTAAIEQQRQLTEKAAAMEAELRLARAIEDQELKPGVVSPGTRVTYEQAGEQRTVTILGPWDQGEGIVSYRAPIAAGMLGAKAGETATLDLPEGSVNVLVKDVVIVVEGAVA